MKIKQFFSYIKGKKNKGINDKYVLRLSEKYFKNNYFKELFKKDDKAILKNKKFNETVKRIRKELYKVYGVFQIKKQWKKDELIKGLEKVTNFNQIKNISLEILKLHTSSRERINDYNIIYSRIFKITKKPNIILDLACGLNPCSIVFIKPNINYFAYDISIGDVNFLNKYFEIIRRLGLNGRAFVSDITKNHKFKNANVCFLFKFLDLTKNRINFFKNLIENLNCDYLVVSFSKKTISLKNMKIVKRTWFVDLLRRLNLQFHELDFENEVFYVIRLNY